MSGSRQVVDVLSLFSGGCEAIAEAAGQYSERSVVALGSALDKHAVLARAIEVEIIPRLMLTHRYSRALDMECSTGRVITPVEVGEFTSIAVQHDATVACAFAEALMSQGATIEQIFTNLFAAAARRLGELWEQDRVSFADVTIGLSRIQQLIHELSPFYEPDEDPIRGACSALLVTMPGEDHSLGVLLVEEFFRRAGWSVWTPHNVSAEQLVAIGRQEHFDMVGISVTCGAEVDCLKKIIHCVRETSLNPDLLVMIGGRFVNEHPGLVEKVGADATDFDGSQAVRRIEVLRPKLALS